MQARGRLDRRHRRYGDRRPGLALDPSYQWVLV